MALLVVAGAFIANALVTVLLAADRHNVPAPTIMIQGQLFGSPLEMDHLERKVLDLLVDLDRDVSLVEPRQLNLNDHGSVRLGPAAPPGRVKSALYCAVADQFEQVQRLTCPSEGGKR